jgi:hypothetical protein
LAGAHVQCLASSLKFTLSVCPGRC